MSWQKESSSAKELLNLAVDNFPVLPRNTDGDFNFLKERTLSANESLGMEASPGKIMEWGLRSSSETALFRFKIFQMPPVARGLRLTSCLSLTGV